VYRGGVLGEPSLVNTNGQDDAKEKMLEPKVKTILWAHRKSTGGAGKGSDFTASL